MRKILCAVLVTLSASAVAAPQVLKISRVSSTDQRLNVQIENAPLSAVVRSLAIHLSKPVSIETGGDRRVSFRATAILAEDVVRAIVAREGMELESRDGWWAIRDPQEPTLTLDVKDADIGTIVQTMKEQCGIRNVMMDPDIRQQRGTFLFYEVPCTLAFKVVFDSLGLAAEIFPNSVLNVETR